MIYVSKEFCCSLPVKLCHFFYQTNRKTRPKQRLAVPKPTKLTEFPSADVIDVDTEKEAADDVEDEKDNPKRSTALRLKTDTHIVREK